jgi:hypothetical protein
MSAVRSDQTQDLPTLPQPVESAVPEQLCFDPLPRVQSIDRESFQRHYLEPEKPVVIENLASNWPALKKWTPEYLGRQYGNRPVNVYDASFADPGSSYMSAVRRLSFGDYLELVLSGSLDARMFLYNIAKQIPQLVDDVQLPTIADGFSKRFVFLFAGCKGSATPIHFDIDMAHVFHTPLTGTRRITLFAPGDSDNLYKHPFTVRSYVNVGSPDFDKYPRLRNARGYQGQLSPGETLFIPSQYWHYVEYEQGGYAISLRCRHQRLRTRMKGYLYLGVLSPTDRLMNRLLGTRWFDWKERRTHASNRRVRRSPQAH